MKPQVKAEYYDFSKYVNQEQFLSYYNQLKLVLEINPSSILEIGNGGKVLERLLPEKINYTSFDLDIELKPSVVGSIEQLPFGENTFDLTVCFEVLEHLPYERFLNNLAELSRVSRGDVIISLPYANNKFSISFFLPIIHKLDITILIPKFYRRHKFDGAHYWEIGKNGFPLSRVTNDVQKIFNIKRRVIFKDNTYHTFFILKKKT